MKYLTFLLLFSANLLANEHEIEPAANEWLALVDKGEYATSWQGTSERFQRLVNEKQWQTALEQVRFPLGKLIHRNVIESTEHAKLPGMPEGRYQVIQFDTQFENKAQSIETLSMMFSDGKWQTIGYFIK
ncbi:DUF4019 domain-containing protein [Pseudoalteromonas sp. G4]|uniref:DUF4019 domain-containing protein n=1 Tax=Pseudoalteromonas sp. G4 TaxID=2992761 RepID=UPI00237E451D|nr:DUF4019 domain-containing protein [Pseudoalteromonas sp. G4]MDE3270530.1 DUF4019 domain-containing protein [Pseudoalteromonas sp. G4]